MKQQNMADDRVWSVTVEGPFIPGRAVMLDEKPPPHVPFAPLFDLRTRMVRPRVQIFFLLTRRSELRFNFATTTEANGVASDEKTRTPKIVENQRILCGTR